jgi:hypothetical protein
MFTQQDHQQFASLGIAAEAVSQQVAYFKSGFPYLDIQKPATVGDGIVRLSEQEVALYASAFEQALAGKDVLKFVPASGAASRMFKDLFSFMNDYDGSETSRKAFESDAKHPVGKFFRDLKRFAFYQALEGTLPEGETLEGLMAKGEYAKILRHLLTEDGLNYGALPKGLLLFHQYENGPRTPLEEHLAEAAHYSKGRGGVAHLHFTVSPEHEEKFRERLEEVRHAFEQAFGASFQVSFSQQKPSTDTVAVDMANAPFRESDGSILFRPGGHGALLENLNDIDADVVFVKNIDNVVPDRIKEETYRYKKALAGLLLQTQDRVFDYLRRLDAGEASEGLAQEIIGFLQEQLCVSDPQAAALPLKEKLAYCRRKLDRPVRVCGMVKNEGEPGGGPFWAANADGSTSLQVVESAQIDLDDADKRAIAHAATHFNPVDLVCAPRNYQGRKFDLLAFRDPQTGFITYKSKDGRELKAQELPGLWNGAMADWNTLFVEVPIITFNPVKTVNDLLRANHQ